MAPANLPYIPEYITVHLGTPTANAPNVQISFPEYIKTVASSEIYPTWPDSALRANIYAQISYALNRVYTEWYRSKGYDYDVTNSPSYDQAYKPGKDVYSNVSKIVDSIFNNYVIKQGSIAPYATQYCNGTTVKCKGLSQWGTVDLAKAGMSSLNILKKYYGNDISIVTDAPVQAVVESYPGIPLKVGSASNDVKTLQTQLNRIAKNYPAIPRIANPDGTFGADTANAVKVFQKTFNLTQDGIVGKSTWYRIKNIYNSVKQLAELSAEGVRLEEVTHIYPTVLKQGTSGTPVAVIQYYLNVIGYFNQTVPLIKIDGYYGKITKDAVTQFQKAYGLKQDGVVGKSTWIKMQSVYDKLYAQLKSGYSGARAQIYPGYVLTKGAKDKNVSKMQEYLVYISSKDKSIPVTAVTGTYGDATAIAVKAFQKKYGLTQSGNVGPLTWNRIAQVYDDYKGVNQ